MFFQVSSVQTASKGSGSVTAAITVAFLIALGWLTDRGRSMMLARRQRQRDASQDVETPDGKRERTSDHEEDSGEETELVSNDFNQIVCLSENFIFRFLHCERE